MPSDTILDEHAVCVIEARRARCLDNKNQSRLAEASILIAFDIPALCDTVKHLRAERLRLLNLVRYCRHELLDNNLITRDEFVSLLNEGSAAHLETYDELQSQLEQLRAENELLKIASADPADKEYGATVYDCKGNYTVLAQNAIDRNLSELRTRAIQLCKDKAADLNREVNKVDPDDDPTYFQILAARIATSNELAEALEKL